MREIHTEGLVHDAIIEDIGMQYVDCALHVTVSHM